MISRRSAALQIWHQLTRKAGAAATRNLSSTVLPRETSPQPEEQHDFSYGAEMKERMASMNNKQRTAFLKEYGHRRLQCSTGSASAEDIQRELHDSGSTPLRFLQDSIERGEASTIVVSVCLHAQWQLFQELSRAGLRQTYSARHGNIAAEVLNLIWSDEKLWLPLVVYDWNATHHLCCLAVLENRDRLILEWTAAKTDSKSHHWRGHLLRALIGAHGMLQPREFCADELLAIFLDAVQRKEHAMASLPARGTFDDACDAPIIHLNLFPAASRLCWYITGTKQHYTSVDLFERFVQFMRDSAFATTIGTPRAEYELARLALCHPRDPDHVPAIALLKKVHGGRRTTLFSDNVKANVASSLEAFALQTALVASHSGKVEDFRWIKEAFGDRINGSKASVQLNKDFTSTVDGGFLIRKYLI